MRLIQGLLLAVVVLDASLMIATRVTSTTSPEQTVGFYAEADSSATAALALPPSR